MGYSWIKLTQDEFGRKGVKQNFALALIVMMFAGVFAFILPAQAAADSWTDTTTENFALGTHENTESVGDNVRLEDMGVGIYYTQGRFTSQAFDAGKVVENWDNISWTVTTPSLTKQMNDNVGAEPDSLIDGNSQVGTISGGSITDTRDNNSVYENIAEESIGSPTYRYVSSYNTVKGTITSFTNQGADNDAYSTLAEGEVAGAPTTENRAVDAQDSSDGTTDLLADAQSDDQTGASPSAVTSGDGWYTVDKGITMHFDSIDTSGISGSITAATLWVQYSVEAGYSGTNSVEWATDETTFNLTDITPADADPDDTIKSHDLYAVGVDTISELEALDIRFESNDGAGPSAVSFDYVWVEVSWTGAPTYQMEIYENINSIPAADSYKLQLEYYLANTNDQFRMQVYNGSGWENVGDNLVQTGPPGVAWENSIPSEWIINNQARVKFVDVDPTSASQDNIYIDYLRVKAENVDYALRWEHRIENIATGFDNYWVRVRGYTSGDGENVMVAIWNSNTSSWENIDNLMTTEKTITKYIAGLNISDYLMGDNISIKYEDWDNTDDNQTTVHIDLCIVQAENVYTTEMKFQVATSADNIVWSDNLGPDGTTSTYFTTSSTSLENIGDNRYFRYIAYFSTEDNTITPVLYDVTINYTLPLVAPDAPTLYLPAGGTITNDNTPTFDWSDVAGAENYDLLVDNDADFSSPEIQVTVSLSTYTPTTELADDNYSWKVIAINAIGENESSTRTFVIDTINPITPTLYLPADGTMTNDNTVYFEWSSIADAENYDLFVDDDSDFFSPEVSVTITDNYYTSSALLDENYKWRVIARDVANNVSDNSATWTFLVDTVAPSVPTPYLPADGTVTNDNTVYFEWSSIGGAKNYDLFVDNDPDFSSPEVSVTITSNYYTSSPLLDENYSWRVNFWKVRARDDINVSDNSPTWTFVIDTMAPATSTLVSLGDNSVGSTLTQTFTWSEPEAGVTYDIQIDNETSFTSPYVHENTGLADNSYTYTFASNGVYYWRVRAVDAANNQSSWADNFKLTIQAPPGQPTLYLLANGTYTNDNIPYFEWTVGAIADNHRLLVDNDPDFSSPEENRIVLDNYYTIADENSLPDDNYSWKVIAINAYGENGSSTWTFLIDTIAPATPTLVSPENDAVESTLTQTFTWSEPEAGVTYDIQIDNETSFTSPYVHEDNDLTSNSYIYTLASNGVYYWRVRAVDVANNQSSWADNFKLTIQAPLGQPTLYLPTDGATMNDDTPTFEWTVGAIADNHRLLVDDDPDFSSPEENRIVLDNYYTIADENSLPDDNYSWKVIAINAQGENGSLTWTFLIDTTPTLESPGDTAVKSDLTPLETVPLPSVGALTVTIGTITADGTGSADFTQYAIAVTGVRITTTSDVSGARVDVVMHTAKPAGAAEVTMPVYIYFDLSTTVDVDYIEGATIKFKVPKPWITRMNVDERMVKLLRYRGGWQRLSTRMVGADFTYLYYEATTSGFSLFAIAGESMVTPTPTPWDTPTVPPPTQSPPFIYAALFTMAGVVGLAVTYRLARPSRYRVMFKRLKQLGREPIRTRVRHIGVPLPEPQARAPGQVSEAELAALRRLEQIGQEKQLRERRS